MNSRQRQPLIAGLTILGALLTLVLGMWLGGHPDVLPGFLRAGLEANHDTQVVNEAIDDVAHDYYRPLKRSDLSNASVAGIVASLHDRFSNYLTPSEYRGFDEAGSFSGIGVEIAPEPRGLRVVRVFDMSPAQRAGLGVADLITAVNGHSLKGIASGPATKMIEGSPGSDVTLAVQRHGVLRSVTITRALVTEPVVASQMRTFHGVRLGIVSLAMFSQGVHGDARVAVDGELRQGARGLVLDLRQNGGGLVEEARLVASIFISQGVIVTTRGRAQPPITLMAAGDAISPKIPLVVLVDADTASASEIVTGALQDHHRAEVVGTHTFGKGVFQEVRPLSNGGALDITVGQYFTPSGRNLGGNGVNQGPGITPDVPVAMSQVDSEAGVRVALSTLAAKLR